MRSVTLDESCIGRVISERPYVKLLSVPSGQIPLFGQATMTCLAQVEGTLSLIEVVIDRELYEPNSPRA